MKRQCAFLKDVQHDVNGHNISSLDLLQDKITTSGNIPHVLHQCVTQNGVRLLEGVVKHFVIREHSTEE